MHSTSFDAGEGRRRVAIENVQPAVDCGRFAIKRTVGETVTVTADVFADGQDVVKAALLHREQGTDAWHEVAMTPLANDRWRGDFQVDEIGRHEYTVRAWVDAFESWQRDLKKRLDAGQNVAVDLSIGAALVGDAAQRAGAGDDARRLRDWQKRLEGPQGLSVYQAGALELEPLMRRHPDRRFAVECDPPFAVVVDREKARYSTWYELFPRSCSGDATRHGTLRDCAKWLPRLAEMGFDVLYLPPIHPIGSTFRKGKNNNVECAPGDAGSPWGIGAKEGGHKAIYRQLGTLDDLHALVAAAGEHGIDVALDIAFQCSPDHPYVSEHPEWFRKRPDGTIQYAENPPKKYQDIYPFDFETDDWKALWRELTDVVLHWCAQGIRIFRVDNPHTKPFGFWEYCIGEIKARYPDVILLSEAFTRPTVMYQLAKLGFTQSYTYFTWRNTKAELTEYFTELTQRGISEYFRPNLWPNTPDILPEHLQVGGRGAFVARLVLAATLSANYGIYGPAFETLENLPREAGSEEYLHSEKYELRAWDFNRPENLGGVIAAVNRARRENSALQSNANLRFHPTDNERIICYSKRNDVDGNLIVVVVSLNYHHVEHGFIELPLGDLGITPGRPYEVHDLLSGGTFSWQGAQNFVELDPHELPAHIFRVTQA
ncbi:MAG: alpha-1,4-glucan--maltose-1-phosphate maltosyltransferase [Pirellulales bacterium]